MPVLISADDRNSSPITNPKNSGSADHYDSENIRFPWCLPKTHLCAVRTLCFRDSCLGTGLVTVDGNRMAEKRLVVRINMRLNHYGSQALQFIGENAISPIYWRQSVFGNLR